MLYHKIPVPIIKISFFLLSTYCSQQELISTPKITALLPNPPIGCEKAPFTSNPIPYSEYLYLSTQAF